MHSYIESLYDSPLQAPLEEMKQYAKETNVPIITDEGLRFLLQMIRLQDAKHVIEIGTAIGYSAIAIALYTNAHVTSIERKIPLVKTAKSYIKKAKLEDRISILPKDALLIDESKINKADVIFIDAAKAQSKRFFEQYQSRLRPNGIIITDNLLFHGLIDKDDIESRNVRQLVRKIDQFNHYLLKQNQFDTTIYSIGDGMSLSRKKVSK